MRDLKLWSQHFNVAFRLIKPGSFDSRTALACMQGNKQPGQRSFSPAIFTALWADAMNYLEEDWLANVAVAADLPSEWVLSDSYSQQINE